MLNCFLFKQIRLLLRRSSRITDRKEETDGATASLPISNGRTWHATDTLDQYNREITCTYRNETYTVRDNGAVFRQRRKNASLRKWDEKWTFGHPSEKDGYMRISSIPVHRIVATTFHGPELSKNMIVDHIDTNRRNNRPENLRWITKLENSLINTTTKKKIALKCGSVEAFLADPSKFRDKFQEPNLKYMRNVSYEEGQISLERMKAWAKSDKHSSGGSLDEWIFNRSSQEQYVEIVPELTSSLTPNAKQKNWKTPSKFPCCPQESTDSPIITYAANLKVGKIFSQNKYSKSITNDFAIAKDENTLWVLCKSDDDNAVKPWSLAQVTYENNLFVHTNLGSFFKKDGADKHFTLAQGLEWTGADTFDDLVS